MTDDTTPPPDLGEETRRVVGVVQDWMRRTAAAGQPSATDPSAVPTDHATHTVNDCQWCPICQFAAVLRGERPDVSEKLAEAGLAIAAAVRSFVDVAVSHVPDPRDSVGSPAPSDASEPQAPRAGRRPSPRVERIDLDGGDG